MKTKPKSILLTFTLLFAAFACCSGAEEKTNYTSTAASDVLEVACKQAAKESKLVFIKSGFPKCVWCRIFDRYHSIPEVQTIIGKYYVVAVMDVVNMPDGKAVFSKFAEPGAPAWVIITPQQAVIIDSYAPTPERRNVGYPGSPTETAYYLAALKKATPAITEDELHVLSQQIQKAMGK
jgi:hypothetical protein